MANWPRSLLSPSMSPGRHRDRRLARIIRRMAPPVSAETIRVFGNDLPSCSDMQLYGTYRRERDIYRNPSKPRIPAAPGTGRPRPVITILIGRLPGTLSRHAVTAAGLPEPDLSAEISARLLNRRGTDCQPGRGSVGSAGVPLPTAAD